MISNWKEPLKYPDKVGKMTILEIICDKIYVTWDTVLLKMESSYSWKASKETALVMPRGCRQTVTWYGQDRLLHSLTAWLYGGKGTHVCLPLSSPLIVTRACATAVKPWAAHAFLTTLSCYKFITLFYDHPSRHFI